MRKTTKRPGEKIVNDIKRATRKQAHSKLGCDKSPILLKSEENGHGPHSCQ